MPHASHRPPAADRQTAMRVVERIREALQNGTWKPGDKLPPEREFAATLGISRSSLRSGLGYLAAMGLLQVRHGVGAFISEAPTQFGAASLPFLDALHGYDIHQLFEARRILEGHIASLAAERTTERHLQQMAEELEEMEASIDQPHEYLIHDVRFHRIVAQAAGNSILAAIMESLTGALYEVRRSTTEQIADLHVTTKFHRDIYRAIRSGNSRTSRAAMEKHLTNAEADEELPPKPKARKRTPTKSKAKTGTAASRS